MTELSKKTKLALLFAAGALLLLIDFLRDRVSQWQRPLRHPHACIDDPLHDLLAPFSRILEHRPFLRKVLLAVDSVLIDSAIVCLGLVWALRGRTKSFIPSLLVFYVLRALILNIAKWPLPRLYLFGDPGVPSFFVDYDQTNDLFFSGHCGGITVMLSDSLLNRRGPWAAFLLALLAYTFFVLSAEGGHYTNDMIVGIVAGLTINRLYFARREDAALWYMRQWGRSLSMLRALILVFAARESPLGVAPPAARKLSADSSSVIDMLRDADASASPRR